MSGKGKIPSTALYTYYILVYYAHATWLLIIIVYNLYTCL